MAKQVKLNAKLRTVAGRGPVKQLRDQGITPGVVYGAHTKPFSITVNSRELGEVLHHATGENVLVDLAVDENGSTSNRLALIQEVQHHPFNDVILHIDLHEVLATEKLRTKVPVRPVGEPAGVKNGGGVLEYILRELHVECLPKDLPDVIEVSVEKLEIGGAIHIGEIAAPAGVELLDDKGQPVFLVVAPIAEEDAATPAAGATAEPEVIGAKPVEGEEAAAGDAKPAAGKADAKPAAAAAAGKAEAKPAAGKAEAKPAAKK
ncbi:MAG: 50S ribosomal protein L25 [Verrucomicrobiota bacterium]